MKSATAVRPEPENMPTPTPDGRQILSVPTYRGARVVASRQRRWGGVAALHLDVRADGVFEVEMRAVFPRLLFTIETLGGQVTVTPERRSALPGLTGPLSIVPAETPIVVWGKARYFQQLVLEFDPQKLATLGGGIDLAAAFQPRFMFTDSYLSRLCLLLADECVSTNPMECRFGDSVILSLLLALARATAEPTPSVGGLTSWQMHRLERFVEERLGGDLSLDCLAQEAAVSRSHFGRVFKLTTGQSPFEWVRTKRIERAKHLLAEGDLSIAEIAIAAGFADQAHLTRAFGRAVGMPPGAWQRAQRRADREGGPAIPLTATASAHRRRY